MLASMFFPLPRITPFSAVGSGSDTTSQYHNGTFVSWEGRLLKTLGCNVGLRGVKAVAPQTVSDSPRRTPMICLPVGWTPPYNPLTGRRRPRVGKRASRLNLMVVRWGSEHCDGAELVSAYVELSSCVAVSRLEKARVGYVRAQIH